MHKWLHNLLIPLLALGLLACSHVTEGQKKNEHKSSEGAHSFILLLNSKSIEQSRETIKRIESNWKSEYVVMALETIYMSRNEEVSSRLLTIIQRKTGKRYGYSFNKWYTWLWNKEETKAVGYADFKADLYKRIDPKFQKYFEDRNESSTIRLDEVRWGGVLQDGIPPLRYPKMISATEADYLQDDNIVFGIEVKGDARAYPKRILAWHEMFVDEVGGMPVAGVYCTLCGTVILYKTEHNGVKYKLGTSGFLYRSNKLMYDKDTQSLWNTLQGEPVIGALINKGIVLEHLSVVTTTWGEWKKRHPKTTVLSEDTGHNRDYGEGVAYKDYFASDQLMFNTPYNDSRLKNKDEVLALRFPEYPHDQLAISEKFLNKNPLYIDKIRKQEFVVLTDKSGANRVYDTKGVRFKNYDRNFELTDHNNTNWRLEESRLISEKGQILDRLPYHRAFWFGWHAAFPNTRLVR